MKKIATAAALCFLLLTGSNFVLANAPSETGLQKTEPFKWYKFGSVDVQLSSDVTQTVAGSKLNISARIQNQNDYPIVEGDLYVKFFKKQSIETDPDVDYFKTIPPKELMNNSNYVIDQWYAIENATLNSKETKKLDFSYQLSSYLPEGEYYLVPFFQQKKKFNLLGLPFTEDVTGAPMNFTIASSEIKGSALFDINNVKLNNEPYQFVGFLKTFSATDAVAIDAPLSNTTSAVQSVKVSWDTYYWDSGDPQNKISSFEETITFSSNETKNLRYEIKPNDYPVNYAVVTAEANGVKSILDIRFGRDSQERTRINSQGLTSFPLEKNQPANIFLTAHAAKQFKSFAPPFNSEEMSKMTPEEYKKSTIKLQEEQEKNQAQYVLTSVLKDQAGNVINEASYAGPITGEVMGFEKSFIPSQNYGFLTLVTQIKDQNGKVIDETTTTYDCQTIDPSKCPVQSMTDIFSGKSPNGYAIFLIAVIFILAMVSIVYYIHKYKQTTKILIIFALPVSLAGVMFLGIGKAEAKSVTVSHPTVPSMSYLWGVSGGKAWTPVYGISGQINYSSSSSAGEEVVNLNPGSEFKVFDTTHSNACAISWSMTGFGGDTPCGYWRPRANIDPSVPYDTIVQDGTWCMVGSLRVAEVFNPPAIQIATSGPVNCQREGSHWRCLTGSVGGEISVSLSYGATYGRPYYKYDIIDCECGYLGGSSGIFEEKISGWSHGADWTSDCRYLPGTPGGSSAAQSRFGGPGWGTGQPCGYPRVINIPAQTITYTYNVVNPSDPPTLDVTGPNILPVGQNGNFVTTGTDPENKKIRYCADWDKNGACDEYSDWVTSGTSTTFTHSWPTAGTKNMQFQATDEDDVSSLWIPWTVNVVEVPVPGICASSPSFCPGTTLTSTTPGICTPGTPINITGNTAGPWSWVCNGIYGGAPSGTCNANKLPNPGCATKEICSGKSYSSCDNTFCTGEAVCSLTSDTKWKCSNGCGSVNCNANILSPKNGECVAVDVCGGAAPADLCTEGTYLSISGSLDGYEHVWKCEGSCGGADAECTARGKKSCGWIETN